MDSIQLVITGLSVVAAILAWVAKLRWSKEFADAKEATIAAKDAQIQVLEKQIEDLRDLTPMKLREYVLSIKDQLEEYNDSLQSQVEKLKSEITEKNQQITSLSEEGAQKRSEVEQVKKEKEELNKKVVYLERIRKELKPVQHQAEVTSRTIADYDLFVIALAKYIENLSPNERERFVNALVASSLPKASILETLHSKNKPGIVTWLDFIEKDKRP